jgi:hypothetical protein
MAEISGSRIRIQLAVPYRRRLGNEMRRRPAAMARQRDASAVGGRRQRRGNEMSSADSKSEVFIVFVDSALYSMPVSVVGTGRGR